MTKVIYLVRSQVTITNLLVPFLYFLFILHPPCFMSVIKASSHLGNYLDSLNDAKAAIRLQPVYMKALERGNFPNMSGNEMLAAR